MDSTPFITSISNKDFSLFKRDLSLLPSSDSRFSLSIRSDEDSPSFPKLTVESSVFHVLAEEDWADGYLVALGFGLDDKVKVSGETAFQHALQYGSSSILLKMMDFGHVPDFDMLRDCTKLNFSKMKRVANHFLEKGVPLVVKSDSGSPSRESFILTAIANNSVAWVKWGVGKNGNVFDANSLNFGFTNLFSSGRDLKKQAARLKLFLLLSTAENKKFEDDWKGFFVELAKSSDDLSKWETAFSQSGRFERFDSQWLSFMNDEEDSERGAALIAIAEKIVFMKKEKFLKDCNVKSCRQGV